MPSFHSVYWVGNYRPVLGCSVLALPSYEGDEICLSCPIFTLCVGSGITDRFLGCSVLALPRYEGVERCLSCPIFTLFIGLGITDRFYGVVFLPSIFMKELRDVCHALFSLCVLGRELLTGF